MFNRSPFPSKFNIGITEVIKDLSVHMSASSEVYSKVKHSQVNLFNRTGFNQLSVITHKVFDYNAEMTLNAEMSAIATLHGEYTREIPHSADTMSGTSNVVANNIRERLQSANMSGVASMYANADKFTIKKFKYTSNLNVGDVLVIDMDRMIVTRNNQNALKHFEGDFFELAPVWSQVRYRDNQASRNVVLITRYKDRWI